jgi:hypothetical protein
MKGGSVGARLGRDHYQVGSGPLEVHSLGPAERAGEGGRVASSIGLPFLLRVAPFVVRKGGEPQGKFVIHAIVEGRKMMRRVLSILTGAFALRPGSQAALADNPHFLFARTRTMS